MEGALRVRVAARCGRTDVVESYARAPYHYLPAIERAGEPPLLTIVNSSGGIAGGDRLQMDLRLDAGAELSLRTQGATRIYRSTRGSAISRCRFVLGEEAMLDYFPDEIIPFAASEYHQETEVELAPGATAMLAEIVTAGRLARDERFEFHRLTLGLRCRIDGEIRLAERYDLRAGDTYGDPAILGDANIWGTFHLLGSEPVATDLVESVDRAVRDTAEGSGAATLGPCGLFARVAGRSLDAIRDALLVARRLVLEKRSSHATVSP